MAVSVRRVLGAALLRGSPAAARRFQATAHATKEKWYAKAKTSSFLKTKEVSFIGAPLAAGQHQAGVEKGPQSVREGGMEAVAHSLGWKFHDVGDVDCEGAAAQFTGISAVDKPKNCEKIGLANGLIHEAVKAEAQKGNFVLTVGGDHSIASATVSAMRSVHEDLCVIWIDAHGDSNTPASSHSGNYHGMPAAHVMNWIQPPLPGFEWLKTENMLKDNHLAIIGLRDVDEVERELLRDSGVAVYTMHEVDKWGIGQVIDMALHRINPNSDRPIHLSFDVDGCDPSIAPGTGTCSRGGLTFRESHFICERLSMTNNLVSMDLVEVNPDLDEPIPGRMHGDCHLVTAKSMTSRLAVELIGSALGRTVI